MLIKCPNCGVEDKAKINKAEKALKCKECNSVIKSNFEEKVKSSIHEETLDTNMIAPGNYIICQTVSDNPEESMKMIMNQELPEVPYEGAGKVKGYKIEGTIKIEAYYE